MEFLNDLIDGIRFTVHGIDCAVSLSGLHRYARRETENDTFQAMEAMVHNLCTCFLGFLAMGDGTNGMFETMIVTILVASISALMRAYGGFAALLAFIRKHARSKRGGMIGIGMLTGLMDIATANNTVAIVIAAPIAKEITREYDIDPRQTASLLDTWSCVFQGIIPYGAQLLVAATLSGISSITIIPYLFYPFLLAACTLISILAVKHKQ